MASNRRADAQRREQQRREELKREILSELSIEELRAEVERRGLYIAKPIRHTPMPSDGVVQFRCNCGFRGDWPCPATGTLGPPAPGLR